MNKQSISNFFKGARQSVAKHSPEILVGIGIAGMLSTTVLAVKATPKALKLIEQAKEDKQKDKLTPAETIKAAWKCYIPAAVTASTSIGCIIWASSTHLKRNAALATAYKLSETALHDYRAKVIETLGEKKEKSIREKVDEEHVKRNPINNTEVIITEKGNTLFLDPVSQRYFTSDIEKVRRIVNDLNEQMINDLFGYVSLNDFYDEIGLDRTSVGDNIGWRLDNGQGLIKIDYGTQLTDDGRPCIVLNYAVAPEYDYQRGY